MKKRKPAPAMYAQKDEVVFEQFAGKYKPAPLPQKKRKKRETLSMQHVFKEHREPDTGPFVISSVPMGAGGTVPIDQDLQDAKEALAWRTGPLYNKGGPQYIGDEDMKAVKEGLTRRRQ